MTRPSAVLLALALAACNVAGDDESLGQQESNIGFSSAEVQAILAQVNYPGTTVRTLDDRAALDYRAAEGIITVRNGPDGISPSKDDKLFSSLAELDAVPFVGETALLRLKSDANLFPAPNGENVEGVIFTGWESEAVVWGVNGASVDELDAFLDVRAAESLHAAAPHANVKGMGPLGYVGTTALKALRAHAFAWWNEMHGSQNLGGTFDGVVFDHGTAVVALEIANQASRDLMVANGVPATGAPPIVGNRPYDTLAQVAAVSGVGKATMQGLHDFAASGDWGAGCDTTVSLRADTHAADINQLLVYVNTIDYPYAEITGWRVDACADITNPAVADALLDQIAASSMLHWAHQPAQQYMQRSGFAPGAGEFVSALDIAEDSIWEHIHDGDWSPSTVADQSLLSRLDDAHDALTDGPRYEPTHYHAASLWIDADECSEEATVLFDAQTGYIWVVLRLPRC